MFDYLCLFTFRKTLEYSVTYKQNLVVHPYRSRGSPFFHFQSTNTQHLAQHRYETQTSNPVIFTDTKLFYLFSKVFFVLRVTLQQRRAKCISIDTNAPILSISISVALQHSIEMNRYWFSQSPNVTNVCFCSPMNADE